MTQAIARLHNFVINERLRKNETSEMNEPVDPTNTVPSYLPTIPRDEDGNMIDLHPLTSLAAEKNSSELREFMVKRVEMLGLARPEKNRLPKKQRLH